VAVEVILTMKRSDTVRTMRVREGKGEEMEEINSERRVYLGEENSTMRRVRV
jgi:hypothetical protein